VEKYPVADITGLVLAGGRGSRMGGTDKGLVTYQGSPMIAHVTGRLRSQVGSLLISCNRNSGQYRNYADALCSDRRPGFQGPLAGIESCAELLDTPMLAVAACDTPILPTDLVSRLFQALGDGDGVFAHDGAREQYLFALLRRKALETLPTYLDGGGRSVKGWYEIINATPVDFSDTRDAFTNVNAA
jgi:molybdopterin-guanine dinucleotide biosynthesis protein A